MRTVPAGALVCVIVLVSCDPTGPDLDLPARYALLSANDRQVETGERLSLSFRVIDGRNGPVAGVTVLWEPEAGGGSVEPASVRTSQGGVASAELIVGPGENRVIARVQGSDLAARFTAHGCSDCGQWSLVRVNDNAFGRAWAGAAVVDGRIWVTGGEDLDSGGWPMSTAAVDVFEPADVTWRRAAPLPIRLSASFAAAVDGKIYVIGGFQPDGQWYGFSSVFAFDPSTGEWTGRTPLALGRFFAAGAVLDGRIYVVGGHVQCDSEWCGPGPLASLEIYDPVADRWTYGPPMNEARANAGAAVLDGKLYVAGGTSGNLWWFDEPVAVVEVYDPLTDRWSPRAPLPASGPVQLVALNDRLYAFASTRELNVSRLFEYDAARDVWERLRDAPAMLFGPAVAAVDGRLYAIGGYSEATDRPWSRRISHGLYVMRR